MEKKQKTNNLGYNFIDRLLHHLALGNSLIKELSFDCGLMFSKSFGQQLKVSQQEFINEKHIFVVGLARAGTTILMRALYDSGEFRSLTYRDMPFVLMPCLWQKVSQFFYKNQVLQERAHGDSIQIGYDSPEALEEVFWKMVSHEKYISDGALIPYSVNKKCIEQFQLYVRQIILSSESQYPLRYLSKNNNNVLRLTSIREAFPNAIIVIPFRDPIQQAYSLLIQHNNFSELHAENEFSRKYMEWLGHYEFGSLHRRFNFSEESKHFSRTGDQLNDINYWLQLWLETYQYLYDHAPDTSFFISYDRLGDEPKFQLAALYKQANLVINGEKLQRMFKTVAKKRVKGIDEDLSLKVKYLYEKLENRMVLCS